MIVSASYDKTIKVWDSQTMQLKNTFVGHSAQVNSIAMAPKGQLMASGGHDGKINLWQIADGEYVKQIPIGSPVHDIAFSPQRFWIAIATESRTLVYDLTSSKFILDHEPERLNLNDEKKDGGKKFKSFATTSVAWSKNGNLLYAGYADNNIRVFELVQDSE